MSSHTRYLEPVDGHEVVYCHSCSHEWYREDSPGLQCPRCTSDITEIIDPENDPRLDDIPPLVGPGSPGTSFSPVDPFDSDPEEEDIEHHMRHSRRSFSASSRANRNPSRSRDEADASGDQDILTRITQMIATNFGEPPGRRGPAPSVLRTGLSFHTTTFARTSPMGSTTTFTIATGPVRGGPGGPGGPDFNAIFPGLLRDVAMAGQVHGMGGGGSGPDTAANRVFADNLRELLQASMNVGTGVHGDAVFTQEALDEIITRLMEQTPLSNAAPPASDEAINSLARIKANAQLLGTEGKAECTICIDEVRLGEEVTALPCKHWFHPDCVTLWLKEHNTCPICRTPMESDGHAGPSGPSSRPPASASAPQQPSRQRPTASARSHAYASYPPSLHRSRPERFANLRENEERLQFIRNLADLRHPLEQQPSASSGGTRRSSLSPPTQRRTYSTSELASRTRVRSPSTSRDLYRGYVATTAGGGGGGGSSSSHSSLERSRENSSSSGSASRGGESGSMNGPSNHSPMSWLRNTFSRNRENPSDDRKRS